jgi:hypothetical protein
LWGILTTPDALVVDLRDTVVMNISGCTGRCLLLLLLLLLLLDALHLFDCRLTSPSASDGSAQKSGRTSASDGAPSIAMAAMPYDRFVKTI